MNARYLRFGYESDRDLACRGIESAKLVKDGEHPLDFLIVETESRAKAID
jgi:hypothetical protein